MGRRDSEADSERPEERRTSGQDDKENTKPNKFGSLFGSLSCAHCGTGFSTLMEYIGHKKVCVPDQNCDTAKDEQLNEKQTRRSDIDPDAPRSKSSPQTFEGQPASFQEKTGSFQEKTGSFQEKTGSFQEKTASF